MSLLLKLTGAATQPVVIHDYRVRGSVVVTSWTPVNPVEVQGATTSYVVRGSTGINSWSYVVPSASGVVDTPINPGVGSITFTGYAPTIAQGANQSILPAVGSLTITGYIPTVAQSANQAVAPGVGSLTFTGYAPTVDRTTSSSYGVAHSYVNRGSVSIVSWLNDGLGTETGAINPGAGTLTISGYAPTVAQSANQAVVPGVGSLTITGYVPTVVQAVNVAINPAAGSLAITGYAPTLAQSANVALVPGAGSMVITGYAPSVAQSVSDAVVGVVHTYVGRGSQQVVSWLNDGISVPVTPDTSTPGYCGEVEMSRGHWYVRRGKRIYLFGSAQEADNWLDADRMAQEAVATAQRTSRRARKRLKDKVLKTYEAPKAEVIDGGLIEAMALRYGLEFDLASLIQQRDIDQIIAMQALAWQMQDDEDIELLLLA